MPVIVISPVIVRSPSMATSPEAYKTYSGRKSVVPIEILCALALPRMTVLPLISVVSYIFTLPVNVVGPSTRISPLSTYILPFSNVMESYTFILPCIVAPPLLTVRVLSTINVLLTIASPDIVTVCTVRSLLIFTLPLTSRVVVGRLVPVPIPTLPELTLCI